MFGHLLKQSFREETGGFRHAEFDPCSATKIESDQKAAVFLGSELLIEAMAKVRNHAIAKYLFRSPPALCRCIETLLLSAGVPTRRCPTRVLRNRCDWTKA